MRLSPLLVVLIGCEPQTGADIEQYEPAADAPPLYINEFVAQGVEGGYSEGADWLELYNAGDETLSLDGLALWSADGGDGSNQLPWPFPADATLDPGAWLVVICDQGTTSGDGYHASFRIRQGGGTIQLYVEADGSEDGRVDAVDFGLQGDGMSVARVPDGSFSWDYLSEPTPGATNGQ